MLLSQLDVVRMKQIKSIIRQQARERCDLEFEAIWAEHQQDMHRYIVTGERRCAGTRRDVRYPKC